MSLLCNNYYKSDSVLPMFRRAVFKYDDNGKQIIAGEKGSEYEEFLQLLEGTCICVSMYMGVKSLNKLNLHLELKAHEQA